MEVECTVSSTASEAVAAADRRRWARRERVREGRKRMAHPRTRVVTARRRRGLGDAARRRREMVPDIVIAAADPSSMVGGW